VVEDRTDATLDASKIFPSFPPQILVVTVSCPLTYRSLLCEGVKGKSVKKK